MITGLGNRRVNCRFSIWVNSLNRMLVKPNRMEAAITLTSTMAVMAGTAPIW
ncbi:hypothetical protein D3C87_2159260 [compost metagenome]